MKPIVISFFLMLPLAAAEFHSDWQGSRPWVGPECQYTRQGNTVKLSTQMAPMGEADAKQVKLDLKQNNEWREAGAAGIHALARTAVFKLEVPKGDVEYRVRYPWKGADAQWSGTFAADPAGLGAPLKTGVFSCDNGYAFPLPTMVRNVTLHDPDLLFFAEKDSNTLRPQTTDEPEMVAHRKGSGHGIVIIPPDRKSAEIEMWRYMFDAENPTPVDQFDGFPQTIRFGD